MRDTADATRSRRELLRLGGLSLGATAMTSCDLLATDPEDEPADAGDRAKGKEAPSLADAVGAGDLPALADRLPKRAMVVEPTAELGRYGGELNLLMVGVGNSLLNTTIGYENLVRFDRGAMNLSEEFVIPNVAESFDKSADASEYTFRLREGMNWSDGKPFTADDIVFWYEDVAMNKELSPTFVEWLKIYGMPQGDEPPLVVEKRDDYTVVFKFSPPNGLFLLNLATQHGTALTSYPAHYLKQFHQNYADDLEQQVADAELENWLDLFSGKADIWSNPELPVLNAWTMTSAADGTKQQVIAERNPYYWKTDPDGSQLPYVDRVVFHYLEQDEAAVLKVTNGEIDVHGSGVVDLRNKPIFARSREEGDYRFIDTIPQDMNYVIIMVNMTDQDPVLREIFGTKDFRIGLSHAINRAEIIDTVFLRQGEPWQAAPRPESPFYNEELARQYTEFSQELANEYLDKVVPERNADEIRLRPDGKPLSFSVEVPADQPTWVDTLELVKPRWREVGIDMQVKSESGELYWNRTLANLHQAAAFGGAGGLGDQLDIFYWVPQNFNTRYAIPWYYWMVDPDDERAEEPPPDTLRQIEVFKNMQMAGDPQQQSELMTEILDNAVDLFYGMGIALQRRAYAVIGNRVGNTPQDDNLIGWLHAELAPTNLHQYFIAEA